MDHRSDAHFPFSRAFALGRTWKTIPHGLSQNFIPPINTVTALYYKSGLGQLSLIDEIAHGTLNNAPRSMEAKEVWRYLSRKDIFFAAGFTDVVPVGMKEIQLRPNQSMIRNRPTYETAVFSGPDESDDQLAAKQFLSCFGMTRVKFGGCTQSWGAHNNQPQNFDCLTNHFSSQPERRRTFEFNRRHQRTMCRRNDGVFFSVGNINISAKTMSGDNLTHVYQFRPVVERDMREQIYDILDNARLFGVTTLPESVSAFEMGVLNEDSSLQRSLAADRRKKMREDRHQYLENSHRYLGERQRLNKSLPPPCRSNESQAYALAQWCLRQLQRRVWNPYSNAQPISIMNPGIHLRSLSLSLSLSLWIKTHFVGF